MDVAVATITVPGAEPDVFRCKSCWTGLKAKNSIRDKYMFNGGALTLDGVAVDDEDTLTSTGAYVFEGGRGIPYFQYVSVLSCSSLVSVYHSSHSSTPFRSPKSH